GQLVPDDHAGRWQAEGGMDVLRHRDGPLLPLVERLGVTTVSDTGGDQFFPAVATDLNGGLAISYSQTMQSNSSYDRYLVQGGPATKVSTASSLPNNDTFFGGSFIGDYE